VSDGALILVGTPIGNLGDMTPRAVAVLREADVIAAEDTRRTRALLTAMEVPAGGKLRAIHGHNERARAAAVVELVRGGARVAYVTDAGTPGISDPGERLVRACLDAGLPVEVVPGPSAALTALVLSGLPTGRFSVEGFLPRKGTDRHERLQAIAADERTVVLFESPHRVRATVDDLGAVCSGDRRIAIARELTKLHEDVWRGRLAEASTHLASAAPRGEYTLVLEGSPVITTVPDDEQLGSEALALVEEGVPTREAADRLAVRFGVSRRRAYDAVIAQRRNR
jgi:16S rRNA (cytidine1402-2'-O)-methyltransferase